MRTTPLYAGGLVPLVLAALAACSGQPQQPAQPEEDSPYNGSDIEGAFTLPDTDFTTTEGENYNLREDSSGTTTAVFFGFTNCPDICPTTMADLGQAVDQLDEDQRERFGVVFVTADPERDDRELIDRWLGSFDPSFTGLRGPLDRTDDAAESMGISIDRPEPEERSGDYNVGHGSQVLVFSPEGESELMWDYGTEPAAMAEDVTALLAEDA
ncbi:SCO family protein [Halostreptopolyspora alba]|uniref:SCO family protein n=1 Tax=Halostreptopolyspora alba TaxID=2487137 RepID=A0A3N0E1M2_9ACTN|nr:SCO family protein [Nocardiopsaceae bacterium YIM 96095]